jgi:D-sedoheptulose 7-phosphate isomerase
MDGKRSFSLSSFYNHCKNYINKLQLACDSIPINKVELLGNALIDAWKNKKQVFIFGNGGSAGNAMHLANDFIFGISKAFGSGIRIHALPSNSSVITCLANDVGYNSIYEYQLALFGNPGDIVIALSGSGNSGNIVEALSYSVNNELQTFAILGFSGGKCLSIAETSIYIPVNDMQIAEDIQIIIGHMLMQYLYSKKDLIIS